MSRSGEGENSNGESIFGMRGTNIHGRKNERVDLQRATFWVLAVSNPHITYWRVDFLNPHPTSARRTDQPGARLHAFLPNRNGRKHEAMNYLHHLTLEERVTNLKLKA